MVEEPASEEAFCYCCQVPLGTETYVCLACGHRQYRTCYCGEKLRPDLAVCPVCEADWSESSRVKSKRKSRSHGSVRGLIRSAVTGAIAFSAISVFLYMAGGRAAQGFGVEAPANLLVRLWYLGKAVTFNASLLNDRFLGFMGNKQLLQLLGLITIGAGVGALWYVLRHNRWIRTRLGLMKSQRHRRAM